MQLHSLCTQNNINLVIVENSLNLLFIISLLQCNLPHQIKSCLKYQWLYALPTRGIH